VFRITSILHFLWTNPKVQRPLWSKHVLIICVWGTNNTMCFLVNDQLDAQFFFYVFISILYMFRKELSDLHTKRSPTESDIYQRLYWYNWFSWWWARGCSKHVENWNKYVEKELCVKLVNKILKKHVSWTINCEGAKTKEMQMNNKYKNI
jgi:hypothetical protein